jgi:hypothetical protein
MSDQQTLAGGPLFLVSLDLELGWGGWDGRVDAAERANLLGARQAIPVLLDLFARYQVRATWAAVGLLLFDSKTELYRYLPERRPAYTHHGLGPYRYLNQIGDNEEADPYHYALSLIRMILSRDGMELGSHTFSHYYCLEPGQTVSDFRADLEAGSAAAERLGARLASLIFPCNQYSPEYLEICAALGFRVFRGNAAGPMHAASRNQIQRSVWRRTARLVDAYVKLPGVQTALPRAENGLLNLPATCFLRPVSQCLRAIEALRMRRIKAAMQSAAVAGTCFHLWWHPHNFGRNLERNIGFLEGILRYYTMLRDNYGMRSLTLGEAAAARKGGGAWQS